MSVRRRTINSRADSGPTGLPDEIQLAKRGVERPTEVAEGDDDVVADRSFANPSKTGRSWPDLIAEQIDEPRVMAVALTVVAFALFLFSGNASNFSDLGKPAILAVVLNSLWFAAPSVRRKKEGAR